MRKVLLRMAYCWTCEDCGRDHFESAIVAELAPEDIAHLRETQGVPDAQTGDFVKMPETVTCPDCGAEFETDHWSDDPTPNNSGS